MLNGLKDYIDRGGSLMYMGGDGFYWRVAFNDTLPGVIEVRRAEDGIRTWKLSLANTIMASPVSSEGCGAALAAPPTHCLAWALLPKDSTSRATIGEGPNSWN